MFLNSSGDLGVKTLGTGVTLSHFQSLLQAPSLMEELMISHSGTDNCEANNFTSLRGMSPGGTALFVLNFWRYFLTCFGTKEGISDFANLGTSMSLVFELC